MERYVGYGYLVLVALGYAFTMAKSREKAKKAAGIGAKAFGGVAPTLLAIFSLVGLLEVFVPRDFIERAFGESGGFVSLFTGGAVGAIAAGPPAAGYPIAASLLNRGAWLPAVAAFIVSWTLVGMISLPFEARVFGARFAIVRNVFSFLFALAIGLLMGVVL